MNKLFALLISTVLCACATTPASSDNQAVQVLIQEAAKATVRHYFLDHPGSAERIAHFREIARVLIETEAVSTVAQLEQVAIAEVMKTTDPVSREDAVGLVKSLSAVIQQYVGAGVLDANAMLQVKGVIAALLSALPTARSNLPQ